VIKNDDGWAVAMTPDGGQVEPALVGPWTMGRDKKNPKPLDSSAFNTLANASMKPSGWPGGRRDARCAASHNHGAPRVSDADGHIVLGILVMGPSATFDSSWDGQVAEPLRRCATEVSRRTGRAVAV
jgi:hypothetical protein